MLFPVRNNNNNNNNIHIHTSRFSGPPLRSLLSLSSQAPLPSLLIIFSLDLDLFSSLLPTPQSYFLSPHPFSPFSVVPRQADLSVVPWDREVVPFSLLLPRSLVVELPGLSLGDNHSFSCKPRSTCQSIVSCLPRQKTFDFVTRRNKAIGFFFFYTFFFNTPASVILYRGFEHCTRHRSS